MISTAALSNQLQLIHDEISILMDEWYELDQHFESARLDRIRELEQQRKQLLNDYINFK